MVIEEKSWQALGKKHNWRERDGGISFELIIKDEFNNKLDRFIWNTKEKFREIMELLRLKYGMGI